METQFGYRDEGEFVGGAYRVKLRNARVYARAVSDGTVMYHFRRLLPDGTIHKEGIRLSIPAIRAMIDLVQTLAEEHPEAFQREDS